MSESSLRDFVAGLDDRPKLAIMVRAWGNKIIHIRMIEADERAKFDKETERRKKRKQELRLRERLIILSADDENGNRAFKPEDEDMLAGKANAAVAQLFLASAKHNGFYFDEDEDESGN